MMIKTDVAPPNAEHQFFLETGGLWSPYDFPLHHPRFIENIYASVTSTEHQGKTSFYPNILIRQALRQLHTAKSTFFERRMMAERWSEFVFIKMTENVSNSL